MCDHAGNPIPAAWRNVMRKRTGWTKKILACILSAAMLAGVSCGKEDNAGQDTGNQNTAGGTNADQPGGENGSGNDGTAVDDTVTIDAIYQAVKEAYGEEYLPQMLLSEDDMQVLYGIEPDWCEEFLIEVPMMSAHVDTFLAIKAKPEHLSEVSDAVNAYVQNLKEDTMQYPANLNKIAASSVVTMGNYVFFIMLGNLTSEQEELDEAEQIPLYEERNQVAIDVIENMLLK